MILPASLFPNSARWRTLTVTDSALDLSHYEELHPAERRQVERAVTSRKAEFGDARWCARQALADLGYPSDTPILRGERGMPVWPAPVVGSLTHTEGLRAAVVAPRSIVHSMGLDAEPAASLPQGVLRSIARPAEIPQLDALELQGIPSPDRLLFCAKEATYKAWFPLTHRWLGFEDAHIDIRPDGTFISYILARPTPVPFMCGRWVITGGYVCAAISLP